MCGRTEHDEHGRCEAGSGRSHCGSGCGEEGGEISLQRRYRTKAERITELESYRNDLRKEVQAVEEQLAAFRA